MLLALAAAVLLASAPNETHEPATPFASPMPDEASDLSKTPGSRIVGLLIPARTRWGLSVQWNGQLGPLGARGESGDRPYQLYAKGVSPRLVCFVMEGKGLGGSREMGAIGPDGKAATFSCAELAPGLDNPFGLRDEAHLAELTVGGVAHGRFELVATSARPLEGVSAGKLLDVARANFDAFLRSANLGRVMDEAGREPTGPAGPKAESVLEGYYPRWDDSKKQLLVRYERRVMRTASYQLSCEHVYRGMPPQPGAVTITHGHGVELGEEIAVDASGAIAWVHVYDPAPVRLENGPKPLPRVPPKPGGCAYDVTAPAIEEARRRAVATPGERFEANGQCVVFGANESLEEMDAQAKACQGGDARACHTLWANTGDEGAFYRCVVGALERRCDAGDAELCDTAAEAATLYGARTRKQVAAYFRKRAALASGSCAKGNAESCVIVADRRAQAGDEDGARRMLSRLCEKGMAGTCGRAGEYFRYLDPAKALALWRKACANGGDGCGQIEDLIMQNAVPWGNDGVQGENRHKVEVMFCEQGEMRGCFFAGRNLVDRKDAEGAVPPLRKACFAPERADFRACHLLRKIHRPRGLAPDPTRAKEADERMQALCEQSRPSCEQYLQYQRD